MASMAAPTVKFTAPALLGRSLRDQLSRHQQTTASSQERLLPPGHMDVATGHLEGRVTEDLLQAEGIAAVVEQIVRRERMAK
jgi:hypothetical protein